MKDPIDCLKCRNFSNTWDSSLPYLCKVFHLRSAFRPSQTILESTGDPCKFFTLRAIKGQENVPAGRHDDEYIPSR